MYVQVEAKQLAQAKLTLETLANTTIVYPCKI
jgi:hypothetical protein